MQNLHISHNIKRLCKKKGVSINKMLADCELVKSFIYDLEKRNNSTSCEKMTRIADYFDVSLDYLVGRTDNPNSHKA